LSAGPEANIGLAFVTGLTTGGLSCLAVQAGLLAASVARQAETDVAAELAAKPELRQKKRVYKKPTKAMRLRERQALALLERPAQESRRHRALPIALFLGSKLAAYTILGLFLGWVGSMFQLSPYGRAALQIGIGIFMLGTAGRLFNLHPVFRYFVIEPPRPITRFIRRYAKQSESTVTTPVFLGALTVLIPCGVTQAMMVLAIGTGSPVLGAAIMFAFVLGTTPVFFGLAYVATRLGEALHSRFLRFAGAVVLILGLISIEGGLNLMGSPYSFSNVFNAVGTALAAPTADDVAAADPQGAVPDPEGTIAVRVYNTAYAPNLIRAPAGKELTLALVTNGTTGCTRSFVVPSLGLQRVLPESGTTQVTIPPRQASGELRFTCSMGMYSGYVRFG